MLQAYSANKVQKNNGGAEGDVVIVLEREKFRQKRIVFSWRFE